MSNVNLTNGLEAGFLPSDDMLKRYKAIAPSLAERLEKAVIQARALSYLENHYAGIASVPSNGTGAPSEKITYAVAALTLSAPFSVLVSILYLIFAK